MTLPDAPDTPRIVMMRSADGGGWEGIGGGPEVPVDTGWRDEPFDPGLSRLRRTHHPTSPDRR